MPTEKWQIVQGYETLYEVSNLGRVRSLDRVGVDSIGRRYYKRGKILRPGRSKSGHYTVSLFKNTRAQSQYVHALVALAFLGSCPVGREVSHGPNGVADNSVSNLSYETRSQNLLNRRRDKTIGKAVRRSDGVVFPSMTMAAEEHGIYPSHIHNVIHGNCRAKTAAGFEWEYANV